MRKLTLAILIALGGCHFDAARGEELTGPACTSVAPSLHDAEIERRLAAAMERFAAEGRAPIRETLAADLDRRTIEGFEPLPATGEVRPAAELRDAIRPSVVIVGKRYLCGKCDRWHSGTATGFAVAANAIVTSLHVIDADRASTFAVMTAAGAIHPVVEVLAANASADLVVLRVDCDDLPPLPMRAGLAPGETVHVLSHPDRAFWYFTSGVLARRFPFRHRSGTSVEMLDITAGFARGSSGGPVIDATGAVVGVVRATDSVYYEEDGDTQRNLQLVFRRCAPIENVLDMAGGD